MRTIIGCIKFNSLKACLFLSVQQYFEWQFSYRLKYCQYTSFFIYFSEDMIESLQRMKDVDGIPRYIVIILFEKRVTLMEFFAFSN